MYLGCQVNGSLVVMPRAVNWEVGKNALIQNITNIYQH